MSETHDHEQPRDDRTPPGPTTHPPASSAGPSASQPPPDEPSGVDRFFTWLREMDVRRDTDNKWLGGVCSGVAARLGVDPIIIRLLLLLLIFFGGVGIALYLTAWVLVPSRSGDIIAERGIKDGEVGPLLLAVLAGIVLFGTIFGGRGDWFGWWIWPLWIIVPIALVVWLVVRRPSGGSQPPYGSVPPPTPVPHPPAPGTEAAPGTPAPTGASDVTPGQETGEDTSAPAGQQTTAQAGPGGYGQPVYAGQPAAYGPPPGSPHPQAPATPQPGAQPPSYGPPPPGVSVPPPGGRPPRRRVRRAGFLAAVVVSGVALAAYGLMVLLDDQLGWDASAHVLGLAAALAVFGLAVLGMGVAGMRSGFTGLLAAILAVATWIAVVVPGTDYRGGFGDRRWQPVLAQSQTYELAVGNARLDLRDYPTTPGSVETLTVSMGAGELRIVVPDDLTVEVDGHVNAGTITENGVDLGQVGSGRDGPGLSVNETVGTGPVDVIVDANLGAGQIRIESEAGR
jgi:phage shock protein PspC (stress-responsive transcriptional regulator)